MIDVEEAREDEGAVKGDDEREIGEKTTIGETAIDVTAEPWEK